MMSHLRVALAPAALAAALVVAACAPQKNAPAAASGGAGEGAGAVMVISPSVWAAYQEYDRIMRPGAFAVSADGTTSGWSYCPETRCVITDSRPKALQACREAGGIDCQIFAVGEEIRVAYRVSADLPTVSVRNIVVEWAGFPELLPGEVIYAPAEQNGRLRTLSPGTFEVCNGSVDQARTSWTLGCPDGLKAGGTYAGLITDEGTHGEGVDSNGRPVRFLVGPPE
jgi:hypothetical protein